MSLQLNNNYAIRNITGLGENEDDITALVVFRTPSRLLVASEVANTASATVPVGVIPGHKYQTLASVSASLYSAVKDMDADIGDFVVYPATQGGMIFFITRFTRGLFLHHGY